MRSLLKSDYWSFSRSPDIGVIFVAPLWLLYEVLAYWINHGWDGYVRTGIDLLIKIGLNQLGIFSGITIFLPFVFAGWFVASRMRKKQKSKIKTVHFGYMFLESFFYALVFGIIVGSITHVFLGTPGLNQSKLSALVIHVGAGVYEELLFRLLFISGTVLFLSKILKKESSFIYVSAVVLSSVLFAAFHYFRLFGEPFSLDSFLFRFVAGIFLAVIFIYRGYGISAYTHSLYNILLIFR